MSSTISSVVGVLTLLIVVWMTSDNLTEFTVGTPISLSSDRTLSNMKTVDGLAKPVEIDVIAGYVSPFTFRKDLKSVEPDDDKAHDLKSIRSGDRLKRVI